MSKSKDRIEALKAELLETSEKNDDELDLFDVALKLSAIHHPNISIDRYRNHVLRLIDRVAARHKYLLDSDHEDKLETRLAALKDVIFIEEGYRGTEGRTNYIEYADIMRVIDRRKGMPIMVSVIYIAVGRALGWDVHGLVIPGHFIVRLDMDGGRLIFDPFNECKILEAPDLRQLVKKVLGPKGELSASYFEPSSNRAIILRSQNNVKTRLIEDEEYESALEIVEIMRLVAPNDYRLLFDAGVLYAKTGAANRAQRVLEEYIDIAPNAADREEAAQLLRQINVSLN